MCHGCFNQLLLRDEFHSGGMAGLLGNAAGMPTRRAFMAYSVAAASALSAVGTAPAFAADDGADFILRGGTIRPLPGATISSALAIKGGKVLAVGDESALSGLKTGDTKVVDLAGRTLLPGLIDPHCHTLLASLIFELLDDVGYAKYPTRDKLVAHLKQVAASTPKGQWIVGSNFDNLLQGGDFTRAELDAISTDHPIFVWYTNGHDACVNSEALKIAGISEDVGDLPGGGHFGRGADGKLNGLVYEESAMLKFAVHFLAKITPELAAKAVTHYSAHMGSVGNTMLHEPGTIRSDWIEQFAKLSNTLACRTSASVMFDDMKGLTPWRSLGLGPKGATVAEFAVLALWRQDRRRRLQPDRDRGADQALSELDLQGFAELRRRPDETDGRRSEGLRPAGADPLQRRLHDRHCARRDRGGLCGLDRSTASTASSMRRWRVPTRFCA